MPKLTNSLLKLGGSSVIYYFQRSLFSAVTWGGADPNLTITSGSKTTVAASIDFVERVYDTDTLIEACVTCDTTDEAGVQSVVINYGGNTYTLTSRTVRNGVQGYWFDIDHSSENLTGAPETRKIYATVTGNSGSRTVGKRFRVADSSDITVTELTWQTSLFEDNTQGNLHDLIAGNNPAGTDCIYEIGDGTWFIPPRTGRTNSDSERWVELRAKPGTNPIVVLLPVDTSYDSNTFRYYEVALRTQRIVFTGLTIDTKYVSSFRGQGTDTTLTGFEYYVAFDRCTLIDSVNNIVGPVCGYPNSNADASVASWPEQYQRQDWFVDRVGQNEALDKRGTSYEVFNSKLFGMNYTSAHTYFNCRMCVGWDMNFIVPTYYQQELRPGYCFNKQQAVGWFDETANDFKTPRVYRNFSGPRNYSIGVTPAPSSAPTYTYDYNDIFDISAMVYTVNSVTEETNYLVDGITRNKVWRVQMNPGDVFSVDAYSKATGGSGSQNTYEWGFWRWSPGSALTLENRTFVGDPLFEGQPQFGDAYQVTTRIVDVGGQDTTELLFFCTNNAAPPQENPGLVAGDRIAFGTWNHADGMQLGSMGSSTPEGPLLENVIIHDVIGIQELQGILVNNFFVAGLHDMVVNNCLFGYPKDSAGNPPADLGTLYSQFNATPHSLALKFSTFRDQAIYFPHTNANITNQHISTSDTIDDLFVGVIADGFASEYELTPIADNWSIRVKDCVSRYSANLAVANKTADYWSIESSSLSNDPLNINSEGVPSLGGNAIATSTAQRLPQTLDGAAATSQVGAITAGSSWAPSVPLHFVYNPTIATGSFNPSINTSVSVSSGTTDVDSRGSVVTTYQWYENGVAVGGATTNSYTTSGTSGVYLTCTVTATNNDEVVRSSVCFGTTQP